MKKYMISLAASLLAIFLMFSAAGCARIEDPAAKAPASEPTAVTLKEVSLDILKDKAGTTEDPAVSAVEPVVTSGETPEPAGEPTDEPSDEAPALEVTIRRTDHSLLDAEGEAIPAPADDMSAAEELLISDDEPAEEELLISDDEPAEKELPVSGDESAEGDLPASDDEPAGEYVNTVEEADRDIFLDLMQQAYSADPYSAMALADLDGDGAEELILCWTPDYMTLRVTVYGRDGNGGAATLYENETVLAGAATYAAELVTLDGGSYLSIHYSNADSTYLNELDLLHVSDGSFAIAHSAAYYEEFEAPYSVWGYMDGNELTDGQLESLRGGETLMSYYAGPMVEDYLASH